ncbi:MAG: phosphotransferase [Bacteroidetes bacterium]|jgi:aminoglycoside phosphotransferase (APT) family kinase protein|nr:phosphotransferase [Bacteroidota bacterium]
MSTPPADTIEVRPDEQFDEGRLADYLRGQLPGTDNDLTVWQFGGGAANLTYLLDYGTHQYVLRRPPLGPVARGAHDMEREYAVLSRLHEAYPPAPRAFLYCDDEDVIGADFFIMERREGIVVRKTLPEVFDTPDAPRQMAFALVDALVDLHAVDYDAVGLGDLGEPEGFIERQVEGWWRRWNKAKTDDLDAMHGVVEWLRDHLPESSDATLVHNDYKLDNAMLDPDDPSHLVAVFDWDMCTLGDPLNDLGALLTYWIQADDPQPFHFMAMMPVDERFPTRQELAQRYADRSGRDIADLQYYHALGLYRLTVILAQIYIRYQRGQTQDERFAALGDLMPLTAQAAQQVADGAWC